jgi:hypothetical protein
MNFGVANMILSSSFKCVLLAFLLAVVLVAVSVHAAAEEDCSPRDFRSDLGPARDQGDLAWCFAFTAADLVTQRLKDQLHGQKISAADLAVTLLTEPSTTLERPMLKHPRLKQYLKEHPEFPSLLHQSRQTALSEFKDLKDLTLNRPFKKKYGVVTYGGDLTSYGGDSAMAIMLANEHGLCLESQYPSRYSSVIKDLNEAAKLYGRDGRENQACKTLPHFNLMATKDIAAIAVANEYHNVADEKCRKRIIPNIPLVPEIVGEMDKPTHLKKYENDPEGKAKLLDKLFSTMNNALTKGRVVAIGYDAYTVMKRGKSDHDDGDHASSIVGRKMINGQCHYLLRNSYGPSCSDLKKGIICDKGHYWVTRERLSDSLYSIEYLE